MKVGDTVCIKTIMYGIQVGIILEDKYCASPKNSFNIKTDVGIFNRPFEHVYGSFLSCLVHSFLFNLYHVRGL